MKRILTGIQNSGRPHLGNVLGAIQPALKSAQQPDTDSLFFIADLHSLTTIKNSAERKSNTLEVAAAWMACGVDDGKKSYLYRQSQIPAVCELTWYLSCVTPYPMLSNAHAFKEKSKHLAQVNAGLFNYPILMTSDIILYNANVVPVGKDQKQHVEIARDIAQIFNRQYGETFVIPKEQIVNSTMMVPGTDGRKMSKSYQNTIDIFMPDKKLRKQIFSIITNSLPVSASKDPEEDHIFSLFRILASEQETELMAEKYRRGNYGYGQAKQDLFDIIKSYFAVEREKYFQYIKHPDQIILKLEAGEEKARSIAEKTLRNVRQKLGYR